MPEGAGLTARLEHPPRPPGACADARRGDRGSPRVRATTHLPPVGSWLTRSCADGRPPRRRSDPAWGRPARPARDDVSATAGSRVPRTGGRAPRPLSALARGGERARDVIQARRDRKDTCEWVEACLHRRDRLGGPGRRARRVPAAGRDRAHLDAPESRVPAPSSGRRRAGILIAPPRPMHPTATLRAQLADHDRDSRRYDRGPCAWHRRC